MSHFILLVSWSLFAWISNFYQARWTGGSQWWLQSFKRQNRLLPSLLFFLLLQADPVALIFCFLAVENISCNLCILDIDKTCNSFFRAQLHRYFHFLLSQLLKWSLGVCVSGSGCFSVWPPLHCVGCDTLLECCSFILRVVFKALMWRVLCLQSHATIMFSPFSFGQKWGFFVCVWLEKMSQEPDWASF